MKTINIIIPVTLLSAGLIYLFAHRKQNKGKISPYPKNYLGEHAAKSSVTGGHPEEMNEMPPIAI